MEGCRSCETFIVFIENDQRKYFEYVGDWIFLLPVKIVWETTMSICWIGTTMIYTSANYVFKRGFGDYINELLIKSDMALDS